MYKLFVVGLPAVIELSNAVCPKTMNIEVIRRKSLSGAGSAIVKEQNIQLGLVDMKGFQTD